MKTRTYEQLFSAELVLRRAELHILQNRQLTDSDCDAYAILARLMADVEEERRRKKRARRRAA